MFSIFNDVFRTATRQNPHVPPTHWTQPPRTPFSGHHDQEVERYRQRLERDRTGLR